MSRPSTFYPPGGGARSSVYPTGGAAPRGPAAKQAELAAKLAELEGLRALRDHSARMYKDVEDLATEVEKLVEGGEAVSSVMTAWQGVFRAIQTARSQSSGRDEVDLVPQTQVRIPVDAE